MSAREWKPGDVALVVNYIGEEKVVRLADNRREWVFSDGSRMRVENCDSARPLVVIDPEDKKAVSRLIRLWGEQYTSWTPDADGPNLDRMQAALREFANPTPPKPEEPTGLGAVVEAIYDNHFVRIDRGRVAWRRVGDTDAANTCAYDDIAVVRVLSEGVPA